MTPAERSQYELYIASVRRDIEDCSKQLQDKQQEIATALAQSEELTIEAATLKVRTKELELDEELVKQSEDAAIKERVLAEKKLMEVGGYERAVRMLHKALQSAKQELQDTKNEKAHIMGEEKKLHQELVQLNMILHKTRVAGVKLKQEYSSAMKSKQDTDEKLERLSMFLQKTIESPTTQSSPRSSPTKPQLSVPPASETSPSKLVLKKVSPSKLTLKEASLSPPSPLPSAASIRSQLAKWTSTSTAGAPGERTSSVSPTATECTSSLPSSVEPSPTASSSD